MTASLPDLLMGAAMYDIILFLAVVWVGVSVIAGVIIGKCIAFAVEDDD